MGSPKKKPTKAKASKEKPSSSSSAPPSSSNPPPPVNDNPSTDFEAGLLFERYKQEGKLDAKSFQNMWRERQKLAQQHQQNNGMYSIYQIFLISVSHIF